MNKIVGRNLKRMREANRFTQEQLAGYLGIQRSAFSNYELGEREMPIELLERAADLLGCDLSLFFEEDEKTVGNMLTCAFRIDDLSSSDLKEIALFKAIVKNYLKMTQLVANEVK